MDSVIKIGKSYSIQMPASFMESLQGKGWFSPIENFDLNLILMNSAIFNEYKFYTNKISILILAVKNFIDR